MVTKWYFLLTKQVSIEVQQPNSTLKHVNFTNFEYSVPTYYKPYGKSI